MIFRGISTRSCMVFLLLLTGCAITDTDPVRVESDFGNSVRNMIELQIYDPRTVHYPVKEPPTSFDGVKANGVLEEYRGDVAKREKVEQPINIQIGR